MIQDLKKAKSSAPREKAKLLVARIVQGFEKNMNCDLDVKSAFDELFAIVERLHRLKMVGGLSAEDANAALNALERVDRVLKVVF